MKNTYVIFLTKSGNRCESGVQLQVQADSEFNAIQIALQRHPGLKVASIKAK